MSEGGEPFFFFFINKKLHSLGTDIQ
jgi:hypothetical protein